MYCLILSKSQVKNRLHENYMYATPVIKKSNQQSLNPAKIDPLFFFKNTK